MLSVILVLSLSVYLSPFVHSASSTDNENPMAIKEESSRIKRSCGGGCGGCGRGGGGGGGGGCNGGQGAQGAQGGDRASRSSAGGLGGLSVHDLLMILPLLAPAPNPLQQPLANPNSDAAGGAIAQLAKIVSRRQTYQYQNLPKSTVTQEEMRKAPAVDQTTLRRELQRLMAEEARRMADVIVTSHPMFDRNLAVPTTTPTTTSTTTRRTTQMPMAEFVDDYDVGTQPANTPPSPAAVSILSTNKAPPGDQCQEDANCVPGAACTKGAAPGTIKYCVCNYPLIGNDGQCVIPGSTG